MQLPGHGSAAGCLHLNYMSLIGAVVIFFDNERIIQLIQIEGDKNCHILIRLLVLEIHPAAFVVKNARNS